jgi:hypothetical protein
MKLNIIILSILTLSSLSVFEIPAQDQQPESQPVSNNQETKPATITQENQSQTQTPPSPKPKPFADTLNIADQFSFAIDKSSNFQDYKVIRQGWMSKLRINTLDTLSTLKSNLNSAREQILMKSTTVDSLQSALNSTQSDLKMKNSFKFFGIMVSKSGYDSIMWSIIIGLIVCLGFMFAAARRSIAVTSQTKKDLNEVKEEFEIFRKKALKSKEEAVRQLYDELSKYKNQK